jgi:hypothetical protein
VGGINSVCKLTSICSTLISRGYGEQKLLIMAHGTSLVLELYIYVLCFITIRVYLKSQNDKYYGRRKYYGSRVFRTTHPHKHELWFSSKIKGNRNEKSERLLLLYRTPDAHSTNTLRQHNKSLKEAQFPCCPTRFC